LESFWVVTLKGCYLRNEWMNEWIWSLLLWASTLHWHNSALVNKRNALSISSENNSLSWSSIYLWSKGRSAADGWVGPPCWSVAIRDAPHYNWHRQKLKNWTLGSVDAVHVIPQSSTARKRPCALSHRNPYSSLNTCTSNQRKGKLICHSVTERAAMHKKFQGPRILRLTASFQPLYRPHQHKPKLAMLNRIHLGWRSAMFPFIILLLVSCYSRCCKRKSHKISNF